MSTIKNTVTIFLIAFIIIVVAILGAGVFLNQNKATSAQPIPQNNANPASNVPNNSAVGVSLADVAKHASSSDCWVVVNDKVYNVTSYIPMHPGGPDKIISLCGKDATVAFETRGGRGPHPAKAQDVLNKYYVGDIIR